MTNVSYIWSQGHNSVEPHHWQGSRHTASKYDILSSEKIAEARWCLWPPFPSSPFKDPHVTGVMSCAHEKGRKTQRHIEGSEHTGLLFLPLVNCYWSISPSAHGPSHTRLKCSPPRFSGSSFLKLLLHLRSLMCVLFPVSGFSCFHFQARRTLDVAAAFLHCACCREE